MPRAKAAKADPAAGVAPAIRPNALWRAVRVVPKARMRLHVEFVDGTSGDVQMQPFLENPRIAGTVFEELRNPAFFARARVELGAIVWPNGADLAPDAMYDAIRAGGSWTPRA